MYIHDDGLTFYLCKQSKRKKKLWRLLVSCFDDPAIQRVFPAILLPIPGLWPGFVARPSVVAILVVVAAAARPARPCAAGRRRQPPTPHASSSAARVSASSLLASAPVDAAPLDTIRMIRMHAHDALRPAI